MKAYLLFLFSFSLILGGCQNSTTPKKTTEISEAEEPDTNSRDQELNQLSWLIGQWEESEEDSRLFTEGLWDKEKSFIIIHFQIFKSNELTLEGREIIGWDPAQKELRSWTFDTDGGFGEGAWIKADGKWNVVTAFTRPDGRKASSVSIFSNISPDGFTWESTSRIVDGNIVPNVGPITVKKKGLS